MMVYLDLFSKDLWSEQPGCCFPRTRITGCTGPRGHVGHVGHVSKQAKGSRCVLLAQKIQNTPGLSNGVCADLIGMIWMIWIPSLASLFKSQMCCLV